MWVSMNPFINLAEARAPDGALMSLHSKGEHYFLRVNGQSLMATNAPESERVLAEVACAGLSTRKSVRVLIGGLGFGFTLRRTLELVGPDALVTVGELTALVVDWNREFLGGVCGECLNDPRVRVQVADIVRLIKGTDPDSLDAVMLDVDNGPNAMVQAGNAALYSPHGLAAIRKVLRPGGRLAIWASVRDVQFPRAFARAGFKVEVVEARATQWAKRCAHTVFLGARLD
jgi:spermidine synthase